MVNCKKSNYKNYPQISIVIWLVAILVGSLLFFWSKESLVPVCFFWSAWR